MAGQIFYLKQNDTLPILEVALKTPAGAAYDLTGATAKVLNILLSDQQTALQRTMAVFGAPTNGVLRYQWVASDWNAGNLVPGPAWPVPPGTFEHHMDYEVTDASGNIVTFPNDGYDILRIVADID